MPKIKLPNGSIIEERRKNGESDGSNRLLWWLMGFFAVFSMTTGSYVMISNAEDINENSTAIQKNTVSIASMDKVLHGIGKQLDRIEIKLEKIK